MKNTHEKKHDRDKKKKHCIYKTIRTKEVVKLKEYVYYASNKT